MYVDSITLAAVADELREQALEGRVQDVIMPDADSLGLELYAGKRVWLLIKAARQAARIHFVDAKMRRGVESPNTLMLLARKYIEGARLSSVEQPAWERILRLSFSGPEGDVTLICEIMDQRSNLILTLGDEIMDCLRRVGANENRYRVIQPKERYLPPPALGKPIPTEINAGQLAAFLQQAGDTPAWRVLVERTIGISPLAAREIVFRASGDAEAPAFDVAGEIVYQALKELIDTVQAHQWQPGVIAAEGGFRAFAAYPITYLEGWQACASISVALTQYFGAPVGEDAYKGSKERAGQQIARVKERARRRLAALERQQADKTKIETLRKQGELLLAYSSVIQPRETHFEAQYDPEEAPLAIPLDPDLSALQNARRYFDKYEKAQRATAGIPALAKAVKQEMDYIAQLEADLELAENWPEIDAVRDELKKSGLWQGQALRSASGKPGLKRINTPEGCLILIGRNSEQNHKLITKFSGPRDLWLHARGKAGGHVIIRTDGRPVPETVIERAAALAAYYSTARTDALAEIDIVERRYVRPIKGGRPGMVTYKNERTLRVKPDKE
jgi:predicted ribosome quality control (RQC) complex YloA/Tae2 family protein